MVKKKLKYLVEDVSRHGQVRLYYRVPNGPKIRIWVSVEHPDFIAAWQAAQRGEQLPKPGQRKPKEEKPAEDTFAGLCEIYFRSAAFAEIAPIGQRTRRGILQHCCQEVTRPGSGVTIGMVPVAKFCSDHVKLLRDRKAGLPGAANNRIKAIRAVFTWRQEGDETARNPCLNIKAMGMAGDGLHSWSMAEVKQYERAHPVGTTARLAFDLALYTAQRRSDIVRLGPSHVDEQGWIVFKQQKTGSEVAIPIIEPLAESIAARPSSGAAFLMTSFGKPFTAPGAGNVFREWCNQAGLPQCSMHGLRKATASRLAELGCGEDEIMAITGHTSGKELTRYTRSARRRVLAKSAMDKLKASLLPAPKSPT